MSFAYEQSIVPGPASTTRNRFSLLPRLLLPKLTLLRAKRTCRNQLTCRVAALIALLAMVVLSGVGCAVTPASGTGNMQPSLVVAKDIDLVRLQGALNPNEVAGVRATASQLFGAAMVIDELNVSDRVTSAPWLPAFLHTVENILEVDNFSLSAEDNEMTIGGTVSSQTVASAIAEMASNSAGNAMTVNSALIYPVAGSAKSLSAAAQIDAAKSTSADNVAGQPVAALAQPSLQAAVPAIARAPQTTVLDSAIAPLKPLSNDSDQDGVPNKYDECKSRHGYPVNERGCQVLNGYLKNVRFYGNTDQLTNRAMKSLDNIVGVMRKHPVSKIAVLSYTSNTGSPWEMRGQARSRARSVVSYLIQNGVDRDRLQAYAFGHRNGSGDQIVIKEID